MTLAVALRHRFPNFALDVAFNAPLPGTVVLFGPSGSGKSTIITILAGLLRPDWGRIALDEGVLLDTEAGICLPPERRGLGVVFQNARLFPHLSVRGNLLFGARRAQEMRIRFEDVAGLLGLERLLQRRPHALSGGEAQRVAIGRALLAQPRLLVMDEPLASLDQPRKAEILPYLARLKTALGLPILYVTHALDEVAQLADWMVLLEAGRIRAAGSLAELSSRGDLPLALRDDAGAVLSARVLRHDAERQLSLLALGTAALWVPLLSAPLGTELRVRIPAREVILATDAPGAISVHNALAGSVRAITPDPLRHAALVEVAIGEHALLARVTPDAVSRLGLAPGSAVFALVKSVAVEVFAPSAASS